MGFSQDEGIDYSETFFPVSKMESMWLALSLDASHGWSVYQMDLKSFFNVDLHKDIYI